MLNNAKQDMWKLEARQLSQKFNQRLIFRDISFQVRSGSSLVLTGPNGSGKTTIVRILCHLIRPSGGNIAYFNDDKEVTGDHLFPAIGLVGPYLQLYNNLTAFENYRFFSRIRGIPVDLEYFRKLMDQMGLRGRELDELRTYSSGMLQRVKYVMALIHKPEILFLDEPTSNLDEKGAGTVYEIMEEQKKGKILIVATNEPGEIKFGDKQIRIAP